MLKHNNPSFAWVAATFLRRSPGLSLTKHAKCNPDCAVNQSLVVQVGRSLSYYAHVDPGQVQEGRFIIESGCRYQASYHPGVVLVEPRDFGT